jgi:uncharacterized protein
MNQTFNIKFSSGIALQASLYDTPTANAIYKILPIKNTVNIWGEEIYFEIPIHLNLEANAKQECELGELGYWPTGNAFCIFFGRTPVSTSEKPRAYSAVNIFGKIIGNLDPLKLIKQNEEIQLYI